MLFLNDKRSDAHCTSPHQPLLRRLSSGSMASAYPESSCRFPMEKSLPPSRPVRYANSLGSSTQRAAGAASVAETTIPICSPRFRAPAADRIARIAASVS